MEQSSSAPQKVTIVPTNFPTHGVWQPQPTYSKNLHTTNIQKVRKTLRAISQVQTRSLTELESKQKRNKEKIESSEVPSCYKRHQKTPEKILNSNSDSTSPFHARAKGPLRSQKKHATAHKQNDCSFLIQEGSKNRHLQWPLFSSRVGVLVHLEFGVEVHLGSRAGSCA